MAVEKVLSYSRSAVGAYDGVAQQRPWDCGPASAQIILQACGVLKDEQWLIDRIGTTTAGTNHAGLIAPVLNELLPGSGYKVVWLSTEPVSDAQVERLWKDIVRSIDAGRGVVLNFESPPWNRPRASYTSNVQPAWGGNYTIYHYVAGMGYAIDDKGDRHIWIADPGFRPFGYWVTLEQAAKLIVPHAYAYAADAPVISLPEPPKPEPKPVPVPSPPVVVPDDDVAVLTARVSKLLDALTALLSILERQHPETLQAYLDVMEGVGK